MDWTAIIVDAIALLSDAVKIGLGAAIGAFAALKLSAREQAATFRRLEWERRKENLDKALSILAAFNKIFGHYRAETMDYFRSKEDGEDVAELTVEISKRAEELRISFDRFYDVEVFLTAVGAKKETDLLAVYGKEIEEFRRKTKYLLDTINVEETNKLYGTIINRRYELLTAISKLYSEHP